MTIDTILHNQGKNALTQLMHRYRRGSYRIIRDPEGVISMWAIEGTGKGPFSVSFADQGRTGTRIEQMSPAFVKALVEYVNKTARR
jgi:hypothetical protein